MKKFLLLVSVVFVVQWREWAAFKSEEDARRVGGFVAAYSTMHAGDAILARVDRRKGFDTLQEAENYKKAILQIGGFSSRRSIMFGDDARIKRVETIETEVK